MKINNYLCKTKTEGPGVRFCIWVQGCSIRCKSCANKHMWDFSLGEDISVDELFEKILKVKTEIEGVTFLGGEPLDQIDEVTEISRKIHNIGLSVVIFTGYKYKTLIQNTKFKELKKYTDILIDGEFDFDKQDFSRPWVGSSNQNYYFLSDRYNKSILDEYKNKFEIHINGNEITMNGMGNTDKIKTICNL